MSERELNRVEVLAQVDDGRLTVDNAANLLDLTRRQIFRLLKRCRQDGRPNRSQVACNTMARLCA
ncbi:helix-turn-helix domain-containing protein [Leisingera sp. MMG026]|uniref:helix-turn-helix domain-containing protein n=1 Tax=Leisingera sp. MMG026 TaxID=2909982 RepID=UPI001F16E023|nr:helix-turn-helix domain-containing protein [Leisingera sp. MMG026]MCF6430594.1 helix-turn-helix domain-containing protein [Leisingera sp. MMG026]